MSQIMYNYPAMLAHAADMAGYAGTLQSLGADIASEQRSEERRVGKECLE